MGWDWMEWDKFIFLKLLAYSYCGFEMLQVMSLHSGEGVSSNV